MSLAPPSFKRLTVDDFISDFSLSSWLSDHSVSMDGGQLKSYVVELLLKELGISKYLRETPCHRGIQPFPNSGWSTGRGDKSWKSIGFT